jgi:hypothetical protein
MERVLTEDQLAELEMEQKREDNEKYNDVKASHPLLDELENMKRNLSKTDIGMLRSYFKNNPRKVYKLHDQYEEQIEHLPNDDPVKISIDQILGNLRIPYAKVICRD